MPTLVQRYNIDRIAVLVLCNPPANGYSHAMHKELDAHVVDVRMDEDIDVIVLRGEGEKFFCAGADIGYLRTLTPEQKYSFCLHANETLLRLENTPKLVIAALNGHCVGGGLEIALACDLRVGRTAIAGTKSDLVGLPEVSLGVLPGTGGTQRLSRVLGRAKALQFMVEGRNVAMDEAVNMGIVHQALPAEGWWPAVLDYARRFCRPHASAAAVGLIKRAVVGGADLPLESGLALERELQQRLFAGADAREGMAAFAEKRAPVFSPNPTVTPAAAPPQPAASAKPTVMQSDPALPTLRADTVARIAPPKAGPSNSAGGSVGNQLGNVKDAVLNLVPRGLVERWLLVPVRRDGDVLTIAMADPSKTAGIREVEEETGLTIKVIGSNDLEISTAIARYYRA